MDARFQKLYDMAVNELVTDILPFWINHGVDEQFGGFHGAADIAGAPIPLSPKCLILNARLVWTFAAGYRILKDPLCLTIAKRAYDYFVKYFIDPEFGGCYYLVTHEGEPLDTKKMIYGQAFAIYALTEYCRATGDMDAINKALAIYALLEKHAFDPVNLGYREMFTREWHYDPAAQKSNINIGGTKTMNTHLHLIEAYTSLLRVHRTPEMIEKVKQHLSVMLTHIVDESIHHYKMFLLDDWTSICDDVSYGHDIEGTWLMMETAEVLGDHASHELAFTPCLDMARACMNESILPDGSMLLEYKADEKKFLTDRSWWIQSETVVGFLNAWQMSSEDAFLDAAVKCFEYIDTYVVDHERGEWYPMIDDSGKPTIGKRGEIYKIDGWKCPYHNARMCYEIIERYNAAR